MQSTAPAGSVLIPVPEVDSDEPVAVIPVASVAPLDGPPDGERINTFALAPVDGESATGAHGMHRALRTEVMGKPLTWVAAAFALGFLFSRLTR